MTRHILKVAVVLAVVAVPFHFTVRPLYSELVMSVAEGLFSSYGPATESVQGEGQAFDLGRGREIERSVVAAHYFADASVAPVAHNILAMWIWIVCASSVRWRRRLLTVALATLAAAFLEALGQSLYGVETYRVTTAVLSGAVMEEVETGLAGATAYLFSYAGLLLVPVLASFWVFPSPHMGVTPFEHVD